MKMLGPQPTRAEARARSIAEQVWARLDAAIQSDGRIADADVVRIKDFVRRETGRLGSKGARLVARTMGSDFWRSWEESRFVYGPTRDPQALNWEASVKKVLDAIGFKRGS